MCAVETRSALERKSDSRFGWAMATAQILIAGVDEAGRGPWAGPVTAGAVILDPAPTVHTPMWLWLSTGVRAVDHAVETLDGPLPPVSDFFFDRFGGLSN